MHADKQKALKNNPLANKFAVWGALSHNGKVVAFPVSNTDAQTLQDAALTHIKGGSTVYTDGQPAYQVLESYGYKHDWVNHSIKQYVNGLVTTNGIESFWALLKRGYVGTFHVMSWQHLHRYVTEFSYRYNSGPGNGDRTIGMLITNAIGRRLKWRVAIGREAA